jgi:phosphoribosyl-AMP cyclohydrolase / phosphoribosyl-ATP pyrophosphohydrolase
LTRTESVDTFAELFGFPALTRTVWIDELKFDERGLVPVVAQDSDTGEVLMVAYANRDALERSLATGAAHYWSRSRQELWQKGETSGNRQHLEELRLDCDGDAVLYRVRQQGPACHTGQASCFFRGPGQEEGRSLPSAAHVLARLERIIEQRDTERPERSYTTYLFEQGIDKTLKKLGEETTETVIAAKNADPDELRREAADLLFHLLVLLRQQRLPLRQLWEELETRFGAPPREKRAAG